MFKRVLNWFQKPQKLRNIDRTFIVKMRGVMYLEETDSSQDDYVEVMPMNKFLNYFTNSDGRASTTGFIQFLAFGDGGC